MPTAGAGDIRAPVVPGQDPQTVITVRGGALDGPSRTKDRLTFMRVQREASETNQRGTSQVGVMWFGDD